MQARVGFAEDHQMVLEGILKVVNGRYNIAGTACNGRDAIKLAEDQNPELMLVDIAMPRLNGIDAVRRIKGVCPNVRVIFVTAKTHVDYIREAFEVGASGYVLKQDAGSELLTAMEEVLAGRFFLSSLIARRDFQKPAGGAASPSKLFTSLTQRQREVLQLVAEGQSAKEIAGNLCISVKTVEFHKKHLMEGLEVRNSADLIRYAVEQGFVAQ